ncbi:flagellum-specific ATP synthase [compost metagenome]
MAGGDAETDLAITLQPRLVHFLRQGLNDNVGMQQSREHLAGVFAPLPAAGG